MGTWVDLTENLKELNLRDAAVTAVRAKTPELLDIQRDQMMRGKGSDRNIGRYHFRSYAEFKVSLSPLAGMWNVDLRLTGSFQDKLKAEVTGEEILIKSDDTKAGKLAEKYGDQIFGLNAAGREEFTDVLRPEFQKIVTSITGLTFN